MNILMSDSNYSNNLMIKSSGLVVVYLNMYAIEHFMELKKKSGFGHQRAK